MTKYEGSTTTTTIIFRYFSILQDLEYSYLALEHPVQRLPTPNQVPTICGAVRLRRESHRVDLGVIWAAAVTGLQHRIGRTSKITQRFPGSVSGNQLGTPRGAQ